MQFKSVAGITFSEDGRSVLLIQRRDVPVWVLPGGGVEAGESPEEAIVREMEEETHLKVAIERCVGHYLPINRLSKATLLFVCRRLTGEIASSPETRGARYFPLDALPEMPPPYLDWIRDSLEPPGPPVLKEMKSVTYRALMAHALRHPILVSRFLLSRAGFPINR